MRAELNQGLIDFLKASPTPFHATASLARRLEAAGYRRFDERDAWHTEAGGRYYVTRNDSSLIAIRLGRRSPLESGFRLVGAHTDSPCLRVKPNPEIARNGFLQLGVEVYGGALFAPWFDRDLSLAGRVTFRANGKLESRLVDFRKAIAVIPNLAIHLNRAANEGWPINAQNELPPIIAQLAPGEAADFRLLLDEQLLREHGITADVVLDYELSFYDTQSAAVVGLNDEFIAGARLDNLLSCHAGLEALLNAEGDENCILVCTDHEEVGSCSHCGADGPFLEQVLRRLLPEGDAFSRAIQRSLLVSADNAHGVHPNYADKHDANHGPALNGGPVIKINSNQRYATNSETAGFFRHLCQDSEVPVQSFVTRSDMGCGSTIGPITASHSGVRSVPFAAQQCVDRMVVGTPGDDLVGPDHSVAPEALALGGALAAQVLGGTADHQALQVVAKETQLDRLPQRAGQQPAPLRGRRQPVADAGAAAVLGEIVQVDDADQASGFDDPAAATPALRPQPLAFANETAGIVRALRQWHPRHPGRQVLAVGAHQAEQFLGARLVEQLQVQVGRNRQYEHARAPFPGSPSSQKVPQVVDAWRYCGTSTLIWMASWRQNSRSQSISRPRWSRLIRLMRRAGLPTATFSGAAASAWSAVGTMSKRTRP